MIPIEYVTGDATEPRGTGRKIIAHVCNDYGGWGAGFVLALSAISQQPEKVYRAWHRASGNLPPELNDRPIFRLGEIQFAAFRDGVFVCNMIAQRGVSCDPTIWGIPLDYEALRRCLRALATKAYAAQATVHMPRIGCGLAGGTWDRVAPIIMRELCAHNVEVVVYDLPNTSAQDAAAHRCGV